MYDECKTCTGPDLHISLNIYSADFKLYPPNTYKNQKFKLAISETTSLFEILKFFAQNVGMNLKFHSFDSKELLL